MSRCVHINKELLKALVTLKAQPRVSLLRVADKSLVTAICECALNILNSNVPVPSSVKSDLFKDRFTIRSLAQSKKPWKLKRLLIVKNAESLVPLIIELVLKHFKNASREEDGSHLAGCVEKAKHAYNRQP